MWQIKNEILFLFHLMNYNQKYQEISISSATVFKKSHPQFRFHSYLMIIYFLAFKVVLDIYFTQN